jgi:hypothetical protein
VLFEDVGYSLHEQACSLLPRCARMYGPYELSAQAISVL